MDKFDLVCILPLYQDNPKVSLDMIASLARQTTKYKVYYKIYWDDTVKGDVLQLIDTVFYICNIKNYDCEHCDNTHSGYKRNRGIEFALENDIDYIWFIDQDDHLILDNTFDVILDFFKANAVNFDILRLGYKIPDTVNEINRKFLYSTITMPWQYVFKAKELANYRYNEELEYGSDVPVTIYYLLDHGYLTYRDNQPASFIISKQFLLITTPIYYYNYLNKNSVMGAVNTTRTNNDMDGTTKLLKDKFDAMKAEGKA